MNNHTPRPTFHVVEPHYGITVITMNDLMRETLVDFIDSIENIPELEIRAFKAALNNPARGREIRDNNGITMNQRTVNALANAITSNWPEPTHETEDDEQPYDRPERRTRHN